MGLWHSGPVLGGSLAREHIHQRGAEARQRWRDADAAASMAATFRLRVVLTGRALALSETR